MAKAWTDVAAADRDAESPVTEDLVTDYHDRDESLITQLVDTRYAEGTSTGTWSAIESVEIYLPAAVGTTDSASVQMVVVTEAKVDSGTTGKVRVRLNAGAWQTSGTISATSYTRTAFTIPASEVGALGDAEYTLEIEAQRDTGAGNVYSRCIWGASRIERL